MTPYQKDQFYLYDYLLAVFCKKQILDISSPWFLCSRTATYIRDQFIFIFPQARKYLPFKSGNTSTG